MQTGQFSCAILQVCTHTYLHAIKLFVIFVIGVSMPHWAREMKVKTSVSTGRQSIEIQMDASSKEIHNRNTGPPAFIVSCFQDPPSRSVSLF